MSTLLERLPTRVAGSGFDIADGPAGLAADDAGGRIAAALQSHLGPVRCARYFGAPVRVRVEGESVVVGVRSEFAASLLGVEGREIVAVIAQGVLGRRPGNVRLEASESTGASSEGAAPLAHVPLREPPSARTRDRASKPTGRRRGGPLTQFDLARFVVGAGNRLAYEAVLSVSSRPGEAGQTPSPGAAAPGLVFVYGGCGLGKTHLVHGAALRRQSLQGRGLAGAGGEVIVLSGEDLVAEYVGSIRSGRIDAWRRRLRAATLLCLDDVSALLGKPGTQQELVYTLDALAARGAAVIVSGPASARTLRAGVGGRPGLSDALASRLLAGMCVEIGAPDAATREAIVHAAARRRGLDLEPAAATTLARCVPDGTSGRELEGLVIKVEAIHRLLHEGRTGAWGSVGGAARVGCATVERALSTAGDAVGAGPVAGGRGAGGARPPVRFSAILSAACAVLGVSEAEVLSSGRHAMVVLARSLCVLTARRTTTMSFPEIARALSRPNHSTVITAYQRVMRQVADGMMVALGPGRGEATLEDLARRVAAAALAT